MTPRCTRPWGADDWESDESANHVRERSPASLPTTVGSGQTSPAMAEPTTEVAACMAELADIRAQQRGLALEKDRLLAELQALLRPLRRPLPDTLLAQP